MPEYILVPLSKDKFAKIDMDDANRVLAFKWSVLCPNPKRNSNVWYGFRMDYSGERNRGIYLHRFVLGVTDRRIVDHRNGDGLDCRKANLRVATNSQNGHNKRMPKKASSVFRGVYLSHSRWRASIMVDGFVHELGSFDTEEEAARSYDETAMRLVGEFAFLNFPDRSAVKP